MRRIFFESIWLAASMAILFSVAGVAGAQDNVALNNAPERSPAYSPYANRRFPTNVYNLTSLTCIAM
jgi:hypothetical protein